MNTIISSRQERIQEIEQKIRLREYTRHLQNLSKILMDEGIPHEEFAGVDTITWFYYKFSHIYSIGKYKRKPECSTAERVLNNINQIKHHREHFHYGVYQVLENIRCLIWRNLGSFGSSDNLTIDMGQLRTNNFMERQKELFVSRERLPDMESGDEKRSDLTMKQQYDLLRKIGKSNQDARDRILARIGDIISACPEQDWHWSEIGDMVRDELEKNKK